MVDLAIGAAIASLKAAGDMAGGFLKLRDIAQVQGKVIELQSVILTAQQGALASQSEQLSLLDEKRGLEKKIADLEAWDRQKERYELSEVGRGALAYTLKVDAKPPEPQHMACANCFDHGRRSILQRHRSNTVEHSFKCPSCAAEIIVPVKDSERKPYRPINLRGGGDWMA